MKKRQYVKTGRYVKSQSVDDEIKTMTERKVMSFMKANPGTVDQNKFDNMKEQVKAGMNFVRDREISKRISQSQHIRVYNLVSTDKDQLHRYIQISMPEVLPKIK